jgi:hypothetical protein
MASGRHVVRWCARRAHPPSAVSRRPQRMLDCVTAAQQRSQPSARRSINARVPVFRSTPLSPRSTPDLGRWLSSVTDGLLLEGSRVILRIPPFAPPFASTTCAALGVGGGMGAARAINAGNGQKAPVPVALLSTLPQDVPSTTRRFATRIECQ